MSLASEVNPGRRRKEVCETRLRSLVSREETITAVGAAGQPRKLGRNIGSGGSTFVVVTVDRLLFAQWGTPRKPHECIRFDEVTHWAHGKQYNRYVLVLTHPPISRRERSPARQFLWFKWGDVEADATRTQTIFRFSRPETEAARAIRAALRDAEVPNDLLRFKESPRAERTGSVFVKRP